MFVAWPLSPFLGKGESFANWMITGQYKTSPRPMFVVSLWDLCTEAVQKTAWGNFILVLDIYFLMYKNIGFLFLKIVTGLSTL